MFKPLRIVLLLSATEASSDMRRFVRSRRRIADRLGRRRGRLARRVWNRIGRHRRRLIGRRERRIRRLRRLGVDEIGP
jgi:hypothetical protein